jgi:hypothetical protein
VLVYDLLVMVGVIGLVAMLLLGFAHGGHNHGGHDHGGHASAGHTGTHTAGHDGSTAAAHGSPAAHAGEHGGHTTHVEWLALLSPLTLFSMALGAGTTGVLLRSMRLPSALTALAALAGAVLFRVAVVGPIWNLVFGFVSRPARALDGALLQPAEVVTHFNALGEGLVRLEVDGQSIDVLARLEHLDQGSPVSRGQRVRIESVDSRTNTVTVSRL